MPNTTVVIPLDPPLLRVANQIAEREKQIETVFAIQVAYETGKQLFEIRENEAVYGSNAVEKIAAYLGKKASWCYNYTALYASFSPEEIKYLAEKRTKSGKRLNVQHLICVSRATTKPKRDKLIKLIFDEDMSARELELFMTSRNERRHGKRGRRPKQPKDAIASVQQIKTKLAEIHNRLDVWQITDTDNQMTESQQEQFSRLKQEAAESLSSLLPRLQDLLRDLLNSDDA